MRNKILIMMMASGYENDKDDEDACFVILQIVMMTRIWMTVKAWC